MVVSDTSIYRQIGNSISANVLSHLLKVILSSVKQGHLSRCFIQDIVPHC